MFLAFEIQLQNKLNLPTKTQNMIFINYVDVDNERIDQIGEKVKKECTEKVINEYLSQWEPWKKHLRCQEVSEVRYDNLKIIQQENWEEKECPITQQATNQPVMIKGDENNIFDFEALMKSFEAFGGKHPTATTPFSLDDVYKVV